MRALAEGKRTLRCGPRRILVASPRGARQSGTTAQRNQLRWGKGGHFVQVGESRLPIRISSSAGLGEQIKGGHALRGSPPETWQGFTWRACTGYISEVRRTDSHVLVLRPGRRARPGPAASATAWARCCRLPSSAQWPLFKYMG